MSTNRIQPLLSPLLLFSFSFLLRFSLISKGPYHLDCLNLAILSERTLETHSLQNLFGPGYPLTVLLGTLFVFAARLFSINDSVIAINFMSVIFSSLCIPVFYTICYKLFDRSTAGLSALILSITPIFLGLSVYGKSHTPSIFFLLVGICYLLSFSKSHNKKSLLMSSLSIGLMGAARLQDMILMIIPLSFLCVFGTNKDGQKHSSQAVKIELLKNFFTFWILASSIVIIFHLPYLDTSHHSLYSLNIAHFWQQGITENFRGPLSSTLIISMIFLLKTFTEVGFALSLVGFIFVLTNRPRIFIFFILWVCIPLLFYGNLHTTVPRFLTFILPPLIMTQGYMLTKLININTLFRTLSLIIYCLILYLSFTSIFPFLYIRHKHALLPDYARWVSGKIEKTARFIATDDSLFYTHYGNLNILHRPMHFLSLKDNDLNQFKQELDTLLSDNIPVYTTSVGLNSYNPDKKFSSLMIGNYSLEIVGTKLYEDWHSGILKQKIFSNHLIQIKKRPII